MQPDKEQNKVRFFPNQERSQTLKPSFRSQKRMFTVFFNQDGPIMVDMLPKGATITGTYYANTVLSQVVHRYRWKTSAEEKRPVENVCDEKCPMKNVRG